MSFGGCEVDTSSDVMATDGDDRLPRAPLPDTKSAGQSTADNASGSSDEASSNADRDMTEEPTDKEGIPSKSALFRRRASLPDMQKPLATPSTIAVTGRALYARALELSGRIRAFFNATWFSHLSVAEASLFSSVWYLIVSREGTYVRLVPKRPSGSMLKTIAASVSTSIDNLCYIRLALFGTEHMFIGVAGTRNFFFDMQPPRAKYFNLVQEFVLVTAQHLLNRKASWFMFGRSGRSGLTPSASPASTPPSSPYKTAVMSPSGAMSPTSPAPATPENAPGQAPVVVGDEVTALPGTSNRQALLWFASGQVPQPQGRPAQPGQDWRALVAQPELTPNEAEQVALVNLRLLGSANVPQSAATVFLDGLGRLHHVLWARPDSSQLGFMDSDDGEPLTVVRVALHGLMTEGDNSVSVHVPLETPTPAQRRVLTTMRKILLTYAARHAAGPEAAAGSDEMES